VAADTEPKSTADTAREQGREVAGQGVEGAKQVASIGMEQAKEVTAEGGRQAKGLLDQARSELMEQAASQQERAADQLQALSHDLGSMASKSGEEGLAKDLAQQASRRIGRVAEWLQQRDPQSLVQELRGFARDKPGTFLAVAAGLGLVAGRATRGGTAGAPEQGGSTSPDYPAEPAAGEDADPAAAVLPARPSRADPTVATPLHDPLTPLTLDDDGSAL